MARVLAGCATRPAFLAADLATQRLPEVLASAPGFDAAAPALFTLEGLLYYLPDAAVRRLLSEVLAVAPPGSVVAFDFLHAEVPTGWLRAARRAVLTRARRPAARRAQVLEGSAPPPPAWAVTRESVAAKGEPFLSGLPASARGVADFLAACAPPGSRPAPADEAADADSAATEAGSAPTDADAAAAEAGGRRWALRACLGPRELAAARLPHLAWSDAAPPVLAFYSCVEAAVVE